MSKGLIAYFSQGGTTARVAESIAAGLRAAQWQVDLCNIKDVQPPDARGYDLIGIGSPVYYYRLPFNVMDYVESLPDLQGLAYLVFVLHGTYRLVPGAPGGVDPHPGNPWLSSWPRPATSERRTRAPWPQPHWR